MISDLLLSIQKHFPIALKHKLKGFDFSTNNKN